MDMGAVEMDMAEVEMDMGPGTELDEGATALYAGAVAAPPSSLNWLE